MTILSPQCCCGAPATLTLTVPSGQTIQALDNANCGTTTTFTANYSYSSSQPLTSAEISGIGIVTANVFDPANPMSKSGSVTLTIDAAALLALPVTTGYSINIDLTITAVVGSMVSTFTQTTSILYPKTHTPWIYWEADASPTPTLSDSAVEDTFRTLGGTTFYKIQLFDIVCPSMSLSATSGTVNFYTGSPIFGTSWCPSRNLGLATFDYTSNGSYALARADASQYSGTPPATWVAFKYSFTVASNGLSQFLTLNPDTLSGKVTVSSIRSFASNLTTVRIYTLDNSSWGGASPPTPAEICQFGVAGSTSSSFVGSGRMTVGVGASNISTTWGGTLLLPIELGDIATVFGWTNWAGSIAVGAACGVQAVIDTNALTPGGICRAFGTTASAKSFTNDWI